MSINYKLTQKIDNLNPEGQKKTGYYPQVVRTKTVDIDYLATQVAHGKRLNAITASRGATPSRTPTTLPTTSLNHSIGILLASYTRAINKQNNTSGSLFRQKTKADCVTNPHETSPSYYNLGFGTRIRLHDPEKEYPQACFNYVHQNPVKSGLLKKPEDWEFSSYRDVCALRNGKLINRERIKEFELK